MPHLILGVDLGLHTVTVAVLEAGFRQLELRGVHTFEVTPGPEPHLARAGDALRTILLQHELRDATLYAALPGDGLSMRLLTLPFSDARKIEQVIGFEMESQMLHSLEEVVLDHMVVKTQPQGASRVLVAAARKEEVRALLDCCADAGIEARALFAAPLAYAALADRMVDEAAGVSAIVDIGPERTNVAIIEGGALLLARTLVRGSDELRGAFPTEEVEPATDEWSFRSPEIHSTTGVTPSPAAVEAALAPLVRELRQTFALAAAELGATPTRLHVCGEGGALPGLCEALGGQLELAAAPLSLTAGSAFEPIPGGIEPPPQAMLAVAIALAGATGRREVDFRRGDFAYKADFSFLRAKAAYMIVCGALVLLAAISSAVAARWQLGRERERLSEALRVATTELFGEAQTDPEAVSGKIKQGIKMDELPIPVATAYDLLGEISSKVPAADKIKLDITELEIRNKKTFIKGTVDSASAVDTIKEGLASIACFSSGKEDLIQKGPITNLPGPSGQQELKQFTLTIASKCP